MEVFFMAGGILAEMSAGIRRLRRRYQATGSLTQAGSRKVHEENSKTWTTHLGGRLQGDLTMSDQVHSDTPHNVKESVDWLYIE